MAEKKPKAPAAPKIPEPPKPYGMLAEYEDPDTLVEASRNAYERGYRKMDAYTPMPVHGLGEAIGKSTTRLPFVVFAAGLFGALGGLGLQTWVNTIDYQMNIGGRPYFTWPMFVPITFESMVLIAGFTTAIALFASCGLPKLYNPLFNSPNFSRASEDRFFLCIEATDPQYNVQEIRAFLEGTGAIKVSEVEQ